MRAKLLMAAALLAASMAGAQAQSAGKRVTINGCVYGGVQMGCLVIRDMKTNQAYNISSAKPRPDAGQGLVVHLTGVVSDRIDFCMQGIILEKIKWNYTKMRCPR